MTDLAAIRQDETASEAMLRVQAQFVRSVYRQLLDDPRVPFDALTPGDLIRHASEWWTIVVKRDDGRMSLVSEDGRREWVTATDGELFLRAAGF